MRWFTVVMVAAFLATALGGCGANFASIYRNYQIEKPNNQANSVLIDAKQRAILSAPASGAGSFTSPEDYHRGRDVIVCAEPSPDALSAISSTFAASGGGLFSSGDQVQASLAAALQETASQLGVRNATIQLLRDGLYRQCEAYMNGLIDKPYYEQIANKYANAMVTLLAIEELAGRGATSVNVAAGTGPKSDTDVSLSGAGAGAASPASPSPNPAPNAPAGAAVQDDGTTQPAPPVGAEAEQSPGTNDNGGGGSGSAQAEASAGGPMVNVNLPQAGSVQPHVSTAVNTMVTWFLTKDTVDYCLRGLFTGNVGGDDKFKDAFIAVCSKVIQDQMAQQNKIAEAYQVSTAGGVVNFDDCSASMRAFWKPDGVNANTDNEQKLRASMRAAGVSGAITTLMNDPESVEVRHRIGASLGLAGCN